MEPPRDAASLELDREDDPTGELGSLAGVLRALAAPPGGSVALSLLLPGTVIEETYEVLRVLGVGGMGVVYAARDRKLGREVAVKVHSAVDAAARARLVREAEALARHKHPNVVAIYRVGEVAGHVYYAMELVAGGTLRSWLRKPRPRRQLLEVLLAAGAGVAAAHRAGLVHRDFKPENVLLDDEGRPRVADFGLAIQATGSESGSGSGSGSGTGSGTGSGSGSGTGSESGSGSGSGPPARVTETRAVAGTPRYMAPEQHRGEAIDERADQFAFCVTAWEALTGAEPFGDTAGAERLLAIARGPASPRGLPAYLERALRRGLSADPSARFRTMEELLTALRDDPAARRRRIALAALVAAAGLAGVVAFTQRAAPPETCAGPSEIEAIWNPPRRAALIAAFGASPSWRAEIAGRVTHALDQRAAAWTETQRRACKKQQVERTWTVSQGEQARACLERRLRELDAAAAVLSDGARTPALTSRAVAVVELLPAAAGCLDLAQLSLDRLNAAPPASPAAAAAVAAAEARLDRAARLIDGGDVAAAQRALDEVSDPQALAVPRVVALRAQHQARLAGERGDADVIDRFTAAFYAARRAGLLALSAELAVGAVVTAVQGGDLPTAERWLQLADADVTGLALGARIRASLGRARAIWLDSSGRVEDALSEIARAVQLMRTVEQGAPLDRLLLSQAALEGGAGHFTEAVAIGRDLAARIEAHFGPYHPTLATVLNNLSLDLTELGRHEEAVASAERAVALTRTMAVGANIDLAERLLNWGVTLQNAGRLREAVERYREARAAFVSIHGERHPDVALCDSDLAGVLAGLSDYAAAKAAGQRAEEIYAEVAPEHAERSTALMNLAMAERALGEPAAAARHIEQSVALARGKQGTRVLLAEALRYQAWIDLDRGRLAPAQAAAEESLRLWTDGDASPQQVARTELVLAEARWRRGQRQEARALVEQALARPVDSATTRRELQEWQATR